MTTQEMSGFGTDWSAATPAGRAYVRLIEPTDVLIELEENDADRQLLQRIRWRYADAVRQLVAVLPLGLANMRPVNAEPDDGQVNTSSLGDDCCSGRGAAGPRLAEWGRLYRFRLVPLRRSSKEPRSDSPCLKRAKDSVDEPLSHLAPTQLRLPCSPSTLQSARPDTLISL